METNLKRYVNPAEGDLWAKISWLRDSLTIMDVSTMNSNQVKIHLTCQKNLEVAESLLSPEWGKFPWLPILKKNYKLVWDVLHGIDENLILLIPADGLYSCAVEVKTTFDMNIKEEKIREEWLGKEGGKGKLKESIEKFENLTDLEDFEIEKYRHIVKSALHIVNEQMDRNFWKLNLNTLVSVLSGIFLAMVVAILVIFKETGHITDLVNLGKVGNVFIDDAIQVALFGLMGSYLSNIMTTEGFLFVSGPFYRYILHVILTKPIMSSFVAVFIYMLEKTKMLFVLVQNETNSKGIININASENIGYVYAVLAIITGFSADKIFRSMIDKFLEKLEEKADKTKETKNE